MYIANVYIENFRNFKTINIPLKQFSIIAGKNDVGKSNLIEAINILLYNSKGNYYAKSLSKFDFNSKRIHEFEKNMRAIYETFKPNFDVDTYVNALFENAPKVIIKLRFDDARNLYEQGLLKGWLNGDDKSQYFEIEYSYYLGNQKKLKKRITDLYTEDLLDNHYSDFSMLLEFYEYHLKSTNNEKTIDYTKIKNFVANTVNAERDTFSSGDTAAATRIIARIIDNGLNIKDRTKLNEQYNVFFSEIQKLSSFRSIYKDITDQNDSIKQFINEINLIPSAKKYRDIIENVTLSYGNDMLFQRGLGTRNLIFLLTLYSYFLNNQKECFNLVCVEEPESHLDINNLKIIVDFFKNSKDKNSMTQLLLSTHSNQIINKLDLGSITILTDDHTAVSLSDIDSDLIYYLAKRENFDTLNMLFATRLILVEGATEEIYINCLLQKEKINNIRVISIGQKGFKTLIKAWKAFHVNSKVDKLGIVRDYDGQKNAKKEHEAFNSDVIHVQTTTGKEFEEDFIKQETNILKLNTLFATSFNIAQMYNYMIDDKLNCIIKICNAIDKGIDFAIPEYINVLLKWIK